MSPQCQRQLSKCQNCAFLQKVWFSVGPAGSHCLSQLQKVHIHTGCRLNQDKRAQTSISEIHLQRCEKAKTNETGRKAKHGFTICQVALLRSLARLHSARAVIFRWKSTNKKSTNYWPIRNDVTSACMEGMFEETPHPLCHLHLFLPGWELHSILRPHFYLPSRELHQTLKIHLYFLVRERSI